MASLYSDASFYLEMLVSLATKSTVLLLAGIMVYGLLRHQSAAIRHLVLSTTLCSLLLLPLLSLTMPSWRILPGWTAWNRPIEPSEWEPGPAAQANHIANHTQPMQEIDSDRTLGASSDSSNGDGIAEGNGAGEPLSSASSSLGQSSAYKRAMEFQSGLAWAICLVWVAGLTMSLVSIIRSLTALTLLAKQSISFNCTVIKNQVSAVADSFEIATPEIHQGDSGSIPMVWGIFHGHLRLPKEATSWSQETLRFVATHELAHLKRRDPLTLLLAKLGLALFWFHPLAWWAMRQMILEREQACDDYVLRKTCKGLAYASTLFELSASNPDSHLAVGMVRQAKIEKRIRAILNPERNRHPVNAVVIIALVFLMLTGTSLVSAAASRSISSERTAGQLIERSFHVLAVADEAATVSRELIGNRSQPVIQESPAPSASDPLDSLVLRAVGYVQSKQQKNGQWIVTDKQMLGRGAEAVATLALVRCSTPGKEKQRQLALDALAKMEPASTYVCSLQIIALCESGQQKYAKRIQSSVQWLCKHQVSAGKNRGGWTYGPPPTQNFADGSNSRFAVWALTTAAQSKFRVPAKTFREATDYWLRAQTKEGGFGYMLANPQSSPTMTMSGVACLSMLKPQLDKQDRLALQIDAAIAKGWKDPQIESKIAKHKNWPLYAYQIYASASELTDKGIVDLDQSHFLKRQTLLEVFGKLQQPDGSIRSSEKLPDARLINTSLAIIAATSLPPESD